MTKPIIAVDQIKLVKNNINTKGINTVSARDLHEFLESKKDFSNWIKSRIEKYEFKENQDFVIIPYDASNNLGEHTSCGFKTKIEYYLTINMAKEISMVERNQKGKEARQYFIRMEEEAIANRYAMLPDFTDPIEAAKAWIKEREAKNLLTETLEKNKDKIEYYDAVMESNDSVEMSIAAKTLNFDMGRNKIFALLRKEGYLQENNEPYQKFCGDKKYFKMIQKQYYTADKLSRTYHQTQILPKGIELIKNLYLKDNPDYKINDIKEILRIAKNIEYGNSQHPKQTEMFN